MPLIIAEILALLEMPLLVGMAWYLWNGTPLKVGGSMAIAEECCCDYTECCCAALDDINTTFSVSFTNGLVGSGTLTSQSAPTGYCASFTGSVTMDASDDCNGELPTVDVTIQCPDTNTGASDIEVTLSGGSANCELDTPTVSTSTCDNGSGKVEITGSFTISEILATCPCDGDTVNFTITED